MREFPAPAAQADAADLPAPRAEDGNEGSVIGDL
jgi:hypothetical protein